MPETTDPIPPSELVIFAAGSLKAAFAEIAMGFKTMSGHSMSVDMVFGAAGLLRQRIEDGETAHVFASANIEHPQKLIAQGKAYQPVSVFARNRICALARPGLDLTSENLIDYLLDPDVRIGMSTPGSDPSGDYVVKLSDQADRLQPGAKERLLRKARHLTGSPATQRPPPGRNQYAWVMDQDVCDIFLTYYTNALRARHDSPTLQTIELPTNLAVSAHYGIVELTGAPETASKLIDFVMSEQARRVFDSYGFE